MIFALSWGNHISVPLDRWDGLTSWEGRGSQKSEEKFVGFALETKANAPNNLG